jgi:hypothetical protein
MAPFTSRFASKFFPIRRYLSTLSLGRFATVCASALSLTALGSQAALGNMRALSNGVYLYGESPQSGTVGAIYFVFQVEADYLTGAVYQPSSSFDCVYGEIEQDQLSLRIINAYDRVEHAYSVALRPAETVLASSEDIVQQPGIDGMYPIYPLTDLDSRLLEICGT